MKNRLKTSYKALYQSSLIEMERLVSKYGTNPLVFPSNRQRAYANMLATESGIEAANRYVCKNIETITNLTSQQLEMMLYVHGALAWWNEMDILHVGYYAMTGRLNTFGWLDKIQPIDFAGKTYDQERIVIQVNGSKTSQSDKVAVIMPDYTGLLDANTGMLPPRQAINQCSTIEDETLSYQLLYFNTLLSAKKAIMAMDNEEQAEATLKQLRDLFDPSNPFYMVVGDRASSIKDSISVSLFGDQFDGSNYTQIIDFYNKKRRNFMGIESPDTYEKKERKITSETEGSNTHTDIILEDGLQCRRKALELIKQYLPIVGINVLEYEVNEKLLKRYSNGADIQSDNQIEDNISDV